MERSGEITGSMISPLLFPYLLYILCVGNLKIPCKKAGFGRLKMQINQMSLFTL